MGYDAVREFNRLKTQYLSTRGGTSGTGRPVATNKLVPKTTWKDVVEFGLVFLDQTHNRHIRICQVNFLLDKGFRMSDLITSYDSKLCYTHTHPSEPQKCLDVNNRKIIGNVPFCGQAPYRVPGATCYKGGESQSYWLNQARLPQNCGRDFTWSSSFKAAKEKWESTFPAAKLIQQYGMTGMMQLPMKVATGEVYPWNEEFWGYGAQYAIARSANGELPDKIDFAVEAIVEAVQELPQRITGLVPDMIPDLGLGISKMWRTMKYITIAGLLGYVLYKFWPREKK
jgi:hypothetical protein